MQNNCQVCGSSPSVCDALRLTPGETDCLTKSGAIAALANFVSETLEAQ